MRIRTAAGTPLALDRARLARFWIVDVNGTTLTLIAATTNSARFPDLIPIAERLVANIRFEE